MARSLIEADLRAIKFMWIPGWRWHTFNAWLDAFTFETAGEWWRHRPWA